MQSGVVHLTCLHTSCSLTINENADPRVLLDLAAWMDAAFRRMAPVRRSERQASALPA